MVKRRRQSFFGVGGVIVAMVTTFFVENILEPLTSGGIQDQYNMVFGTQDRYNMGVVKNWIFGTATPSVAMATTHIWKNNLIFL